MAEFSPTERIGVNATEKIFLENFKWIFREQPVSDVGIDAHVEIVDNETPTGKLIALQIKTGKSHFNIHDDKLIYYGKLRHLEYWVNHSLPVILIAHLLDSDETFWALVSSENIILTKTSWKIEIPKNQKLETKFIGDFAEIGDGTEEVMKRRKLFIDKPLMEIIQSGGEVFVVFMQWLHKSLNRTPIKIIIMKDGHESIAKEWAIAYAGYKNEEVMKRIFPWANVGIDEDYYRDNMDEQSLSQMYNLDVLYNKEFYPYQVQCNEAADFRLELTLNDLGKGFLTYIEYLENGKVF